MKDVTAIFRLPPPPLPFLAEWLPRSTPPYGATNRNNKYGSTRNEILQVNPSEFLGKTSNYLSINDKVCQ